MSLDVAGGNFHSVGDLDLHAPVTAPLLVARPRGNRLGETLEKAADLEGDQVAGQIFDVGCLRFAVSPDVTRRDLDSTGNAAVDERRGDGHVRLDVGIAIELGQGLGYPEDGRNVVSLALSRRQRQPLALLELSPALHDAAGEVAGAESEAHPGFLLGVLEVGSQTELVEADVVSRARRTLVPIERVTDDWRDGAVGQDLHLHVEQIPIAIVGVLARDDSAVEERIGKRRQFAEELHLAVVDPQPIHVRLARLEPEPSGGPGTQVGGVDAQEVDKGSSDGSGRKSQRAKKKPLTLVDLTPVHVLVAFHIHEPVAELEVERDLLGGGRGARQCRAEEQRRDPSRSQRALT
jgi:hypothetical protein